MSDVIRWPLTPRPIPLPSLPERRAGLARVLWSSPTEYRTAAICRQANLLRAWVTETTESVDVAFAREQLEAALKSLQARS